LSKSPCTCLHVVLQSFETIHHEAPATSRKPNIDTYMRETCMPFGKKTPYLHIKQRTRNIAASVDRGLPHSIVPLRRSASRSRMTGNLTRWVRVRRQAGPRRVVGYLVEYVIAPVCVGSVARRKQVEEVREGRPGVLVVGIHPVALCVYVCTL